MQRDTDRNTDDVASSEGDNDDPSRLNENLGQRIGDGASNTRYEVPGETGSLAEGPEHASHLRQMSNSTAPQLGGAQANLNQSALKSSPTLTARQLELLAQFEQDLNAKAQAARQVQATGEHVRFPHLFAGGMAFTSSSKDVNDNASLTTETNKSSLQDSLKNSENKDQLDSDDQYFDDKTPNGDGVDVSSTESAPGDVENVTRPILNGDAESGTDASAVSAPGDVENVTRFFLTASQTSLTHSLFGNEPSLILRNVDDEETGISSVSSLGDRENGNRRNPSENQTDPTMASYQDSSVREVGDNAERSFAVAVLIDDSNIATPPGATSIDPGAKPPLFKSARFYFWLFVSTVVLAAVAAVATFASLKLQAQPQASNAAPSASMEGSDVFSSFVSLLGEAALSSADSYAKQAAHWMIYDDETRLSKDSENLIQRFVLCLFYMTTTQNTPWRSCGRSQAPEMVNCTYQYLIGADFSLEDVGSGAVVLVFENTTSSRWLSSTHECKWAGVVCDPNDAVIGLDLGGQGIRANLPTELSLLSNLQGLVLYWNEFSGTLPSELAALSVLTHIELNSNYFTGTIPQGWSGFPHIQLLNLNDNLLTGTWPMELNNVRSLRNLYVHENLLSGTLPTEIALLASLGTCSQFEMADVSYSQPLVVQFLFLRLYSAVAILTEPINWTCAY
jgi:hypothetical protein